MRIFIDGDACPVKAEALKVAARHRLPVVIVSNGGLRPSRDPMVTHVVVAKSADAADDWIVDNMRAGEIKGHNPGFTREDRSRFLGELDRLARRMKPAG